ncbi:MAG: DUF2799 domain-containing protein, partial [Woeseia sp.]
MKHRILTSAMLLMLVGLGGCASMNANECLLGDWHTIGFEDGSQGYTTERLGEHRKACAKHGVAPDFVAYRAGRDEGLREFCQPARGFSLGESGYRYNGVCSVDLEANFLDAYRRGQQLYGLRSSVNEVNRAIDARRKELSNVEQQIRDTEALLISAETSSEDRILALVDLKELSEAAGRL